jgi:hypothetical protein
MASAKTAAAKTASAKKASAKKEPWDTKRPEKLVKHLSGDEKAKAAASAQKQGRSTPSLVDNMNAAKKSTAKKSTPRSRRR